MYYPNKSRMLDFFIYKKVQKAGLFSFVCIFLHELLLLECDTGPVPTRLKILFMFRTIYYSSRKVSY